MRFFYALAALAFLSTPAMAQALADQVEPELVVATANPDIAFTFNNVDVGPADLPGAYYPADSSLSLYVGYSIFTANNDGVTGIGTVYSTPGVTAPAVVARKADGTEAIGCTTAPAGGNEGSPTDIANDIAGKIVLIQRGTCSFVYKVQNAIRAGAVGVAIYNQDSRGGSTDPSTGDIVGGMIAASGFTEQLTIPAILLPNGIGRPIVDEITSGAAVTLTIRAYTGGVAAEPTAGTTNSGLLVRGANPFSFSTDLQLFTEQAEAVRVELFNVRGQLVQTLLNGTVAGERAVTLSSANLAPGVYFVRATGETFTAQQQVTVVR